MDDYIDSFADAKVFLALGNSAGYWQIAMGKDANDKTDFVTHQGVIWHIRMPFGLKIVLATVQRAMEVIVLKVKCQHALVYLEVFVVFSEEPSQHDEQIATVSRLM